MVTPQEKQEGLGQSLEVNELYFKREDLNPYGSHKGRSIPRMIEESLKKGISRYAISSSGNAALAAALFVHNYNKEHSESPVELEIFIGKKIKESKRAKLESLKDVHIAITHVERPLQSLFNKTQDAEVKGLRQSNDDTALLGYADLAKELLKIKNLEAVFVPTSSGTTAEALLKTFKDADRDVEVHIIQTMSCHPLTNEFTDVMETEEISIADAIVDQTALRKETLIPLIKESGGNGYVVTNDEIKSAIELVKTHSNLSISTNSALSVAGLMQANYTGKKWNGAVVCLITGE